MFLVTALLIGGCFSALPHEVETADVVAQLNSGALRPKKLVVDSAGRRVSIRSDTPLRFCRSDGSRTPWIDALTFGLGSGIAGMAGVALSQIGNVSPNLGTVYIVDSFLVVVFGGVGNLLGTLVGALSLGIVNKFLEPVAGAILAKIVVLVAIILFIQRRPRGLFALKGRTAEAEA